MPTARPRRLARYGAASFACIHVRRMAAQISPGWTGGFGRSRAFDGRRECLEPTPTLLRARGRRGHQNGAAIVPVLKGVCATEHLEEEFAVFRAACDGSSQLRMSAEDLSPLDKFVRDASREVGKPFVEECSKSIEVVERVERPVNLYWPAHGRNPGVPHVRSHCTTRSRDTREPSAALVQLATMRLTTWVFKRHQGLAEVRSASCARTTVISPARWTLATFASLGAEHVGSGMVDGQRRRSRCSTVLCQPRSPSGPDERSEPGTQQENRSRFRVLALPHRSGQG